MGGLLSASMPGVDVSYPAGTSIGDVNFILMIVA